jgi:hypothetical protein
LTAIERQLTEGSSPLDRLADPSSALDVRGVLSSSYRSLSPSAARLFRLLGLLPTAELSTAAASSLLEVSPSLARAPLDELAAAHLVYEHAPDRFTVHDLLRAYAAELTTTHDARRTGAATR